MAEVSGFTFWWAEETVCERESDEAGQGENEVWEELALYLKLAEFTEHYKSCDRYLFIVIVVGRHLEAGDTSEVAGLSARVQKLKTARTADALRISIQTGKK